MYEMLGCERVVCCGNFDGIKYKYISYKKGDSSFEVSSPLLVVRCCYFALFHLLLLFHHHAYLFMLQTHLNCKLTI